MAFVGFDYNGFDIVLLPPSMVFTGEYETVKYDVHPIIKWLSKYLPIDPWIEGKKPIFKDDNADKCFRIGNKFFVGNSAFRAIKQELKGQQK